MNSYISRSLLVILVFLAVDFSINLLAKNIFNYDLIPNRHRTSSEIFYFEFQPGVDKSRTKHRNVEYFTSTNSLGFIDATSREVPLSSSTKRILILGDSLAEGVGIDYQDTFSGRLQEKLGSQNIEILNGSFASYSPTIYFKKVDHLINFVGLKFDHLVLFLDISDIHDEVRQFHLDDGRVSAKNLFSNRLHKNTFFFLRDHFYATFLLFDNWLRPDKSSPRKAGKKWLTERTTWPVNAQFADSIAEPGLRKSAKHLEGIKEILEKNSISFNLVIYPIGRRISTADQNSIHVKFWESWAAEKNVKLINLYPEFAKLGGSISELFLPKDLHWNKRGHKFISDKIEPYLLENVIDSK